MKSKFGNLVNESALNLKCEPRYGNFSITFQDDHPMSRWEAGSTQNVLTYIGRLGDEMDFRDLPASLQTWLFIRPQGG